MRQLHFKQHFNDLMIDRRIAQIPMAYVRLMSDAVLSILSVAAAYISKKIPTKNFTDNYDP